jgi:hypothetical protein
MSIPPTLELFGNLEEMLYTTGRDDKESPSPLFTLIAENKVTNIIINLIKHTIKLVKVDNQDIEDIIKGYATGRDCRKEDIIFYLMLIDLINYNIDEYIDVKKILSEQYSIFTKDKTGCSSFHFIECKNAKHKSENTNIYKIDQDGYKIEFINQGQYPLDFNHGKNSHGLSFTFHKLYDGKINLTGKPSFVFKFEMLTNVYSIESAKTYFKSLTTFSSWEIHICDKEGNLLVYNTKTQNNTLKTLDIDDYLYFNTLNNPQLISLNDVKEIALEKFNVEYIANLKVSKNKLINLNTTYISKIGTSSHVLTQKDVSKCLKNNHLVLANEYNNEGDKTGLYHQFQMYMAENNNPKVEFLLCSLFYQDHRTTNELNLIDKKITKLKDAPINKVSYQLLKELITIDLGHRITSQNSIVNLYKEKNKIIRMAIRSQLKINLKKLDIEFPTLDLLYKLKILS